MLYGSALGHRTLVHYGCGTIGPDYRLGTHDILGMPRAENIPRAAG